MYSSTLYTLEHGITQLLWIDPTCRRNAGSDPTLQVFQSSEDGSLGTQQKTWLLAGWMVVRPHVSVGFSVFFFKYIYIYIIYMHFFNDMQWYTYHGDDGDGGLCFGGVLRKRAMFNHWMCWECNLTYRVQPQRDPDDEIFTNVWGFEYLKHIVLILWGGYAWVSTDIPRMVVWQFFPEQRANEKVGDSKHLPISET